MTDSVTEVVDLLILGGGPAGIALARAAATRGDRVALVERDGLGGTAVRSGDLPLATLRASLVAGERSEAVLRTTLTSASTDAATAIAAELDALGVEVITGGARFVAAREVFVSRAARTLTAPRIVLALGTESALPPLPGLIDALPLTTASALRLRALPSSLLVIGGGASGIELATVFADLGVEITLAEREPQLLRGATPVVAAALTEALRATGVTVLLNNAVGAVMRRPDGRVQSTLADGTKLMTEEILVAVGRTPATAGLGLDLAGVELNPDGTVHVDSGFATSAPGIWALGTVTGTAPDTAAAATQYLAFLDEAACEAAPMTVWASPPVTDIVLVAPLP